MNLCAPFINLDLYTFLCVYACMCVRVYLWCTTATTTLLGQEASLELAQIKSILCTCATEVEAEATKKQQEPLSAYSKKMMDVEFRKKVRTR